MWSYDAKRTALRDKGFTFLGVVEGESIYCNLSSKQSIDNTLDFLGKITGEKWEIYRRGNNMNDSVNYEKTVFYRPSMYRVKHGFLRFCGDNFAEAPLNCTDCSEMFKDTQLGKGFIFKGFDSGIITIMSGMFDYCIFGEGFEFGEGFSTKGVKNFDKMFYGAKFPVGFSLGDNFDTSDAQSMENMFNLSKLQYGFSLGNKFNTKNVKFMVGMFHKCYFPYGFTLGDKFSTESAISFDYMFRQCVFPEDFYLPDCFVYNKRTETYKMFEYASLPGSFDISSFEDVDKIINWLKYRDRNGNNGTKELCAFGS